MKKLLLSFVYILLLFSLENAVNAQVYRQAIVDGSDEYDYDHNHYSVEATGQNYIIGGSLFHTGSEFSNEIHIASIDLNGNILWENKYSFSNGYMRCLDIELGRDEEIYATGYVEINGNKKIFILHLTKNGSIILFKYLSNIIQEESIGLKILYSDNGIIIAGYAAVDVSSLSSPKEAVVVSLDHNLKVQWINRINSTQAIDNAYDMANEIVEVPGKGYFITGSISFKFLNTGMYYEGQGVLAVLYGYKGNIIWNRSFQSLPLATPWDHKNHVGVSALYDNATDRIILLSNNSTYHSFQISEISNVSTSATISNHYVHDMQGFLNSDVAAFDMVWSNSGMPNVVITGFLKPLASSHFDHLNYFMAEFNTATGNSIWSKYWDVLNNDYGKHDKEFLEVYDTKQPFINTPEILSNTPNNSGYFRLGYLKDSYNYDLEILQTNLNGETGCENSYSYRIVSTIDQMIPLVSTPVTCNTIQNDISELFIYNDFNSSCDRNYTCSVNAEIDHQDMGCHDVDFTANASTNGAIIEYRWDFGDGSSYVFGQNVSHTYTDYTQWNCGFEVCLRVIATTDISQCTTTVCKLIEMPSQSCQHCQVIGGKVNQNSSINESALNNIDIYPNPTRGYISIESQNDISDEGINVNMIDKLGRIVIHDIPLDERSMNIDLSNYPSGLYFLNFRRKGEIIKSKKVIRY